MRLLRVLAVLAALLPFPALAAGTANKIEGTGSSASPRGGVISIYCVSGCGSTTASVVADTGAPTKVEGVGASAAPIGGVLSVNCVAGCSGGGGSGTMTSITNSDGTITLSSNPCTVTCSVSVTAGVFAPIGQGQIITSNPTITAANWAACKVFTVNAASLTLTLPVSTTLSTAGCLAVVTLANAATLAPNAADAVNNGTTGASVTLPANTTNLVTTDGGGNIYVSIPTGGGSGVPSIAGTANQITETGSPGATTLSLPSAIIAPGSLEVTTTTKLDGATTGTTLALGGATIGTDNLGVTGTATISGNVSGAAFIPTSTTVPAFGIYLASAGILAVANSSARVFNIGSTIAANSSSGPSIPSAAVNCTSSMISPNRGSLTSGLGAQASGNVCIGAAGTEMMRWTSTAAIQEAGQFVDKGYAIASLPTGIQGGRAFVTDQLTTCPAIGGTFTAGGSAVCPAFYNGTAWISP